ncbi:MAG TPA: arginase family protein, partial [Ktedonobacterales bacterium]|nr:arginase family protein [Ktedonobacterales bacterium]
VFYHAIEEGLVDAARMVEIGIRSPVQREVWNWTIGRGVTVLTAQQVHAMASGAVADRVRTKIGGTPVI